MTSTPACLRSARLLTSHKCQAEDGYPWRGEIEDVAEAFEDKPGEIPGLRLSRRPESRTGRQIRSGAPSAQGFDRHRQRLANQEGRHRRDEQVERGVIEIAARKEADQQRAENKDP